MASLTTNPDHQINMSEENSLQLVSFEGVNLLERVCI